MTLSIQRQTRSLFCPCCNRRTDTLGYHEGNPQSKTKLHLQKAPQYDNTYPPPFDNKPWNASKPPPAPGTHGFNGPCSYFEMPSGDSHWPEMSKSMSMPAQPVSKYAAQASYRQDSWNLSLCPNDQGHTLWWSTTNLPSSHGFTTIIVPMDQFFNACKLVCL